MQPVKIEDLSIYHAGGDTKQIISPNTSSQSSLNVGNSAMSLVSEVKEKYLRALKTYADFKEYALSTEGKIKFSVMSASFLAGGVLAIRSKSTRMWYKRMIPVGTLICASSVCYPYKAYEVSKTITLTSYHTTLACGRIMRRSFQFISTKYSNYRKQMETDALEKEPEEMVKLNSSMFC